MYLLYLQSMKVINCIDDIHGILHGKKTLK